MKIIATIGLQASGKSTFAKEQVKQTQKINGKKIYTTVRVNRDDLRAMLFNDICLDAREDLITKAQRNLVEMAVRQGKNVIIDDTNLNPAHLTAWADFTRVLNLTLVAEAKERGVEETKPLVTFETKSFLDVPIEECIKRDKVRANRVGRNVIEGTALRYGMIDFSTHNTWCCVDIDGTMSLLGDRRKFVTDGNKDWNSFFKNVHLDEVNEEVRTIINKARSRGVGIIFLSGRPSDKCGIATEDWLEKHGIEYNHLFMRRVKDSRSDVIIKDEIFQLLPKDKMEFVIDDRRCMISYWNETFKDTPTKVIDVGDGTEY